MKKLKKILFLAFIVSIIVSCSPKTPYIYVSTDGDDLNKGSKNQPYKTIKRAQKEVRKWIQSDYIGEIEIVISDGVYELNEPLRFSIKDSGNDSLKIIYRAKMGANPIISGGKTITDIEEDNNIWNFNLPENKKRDYYDIYVNGRRATRARTPNVGFATIKDISEEILIQGCQSLNRVDLN